MKKYLVESCPTCELSKETVLERTTQYNKFLGRPFLVKIFGILLCPPIFSRIPFQFLKERRLNILNGSTFYLTLPGKDSVEDYS